MCGDVFFLRCSIILYFIRLIYNYFNWVVLTNRWHDTHRISMWTIEISLSNRYLLLLFFFSVARLFIDSHTIDAKMVKIWNSCEIITTRKCLKWEKNVSSGCLNLSLSIIEYAVYAQLRSTSSSYILFNKNPFSTPCTIIYMHIEMWYFNLLIFFDLCKSDWKLNAYWIENWVKWRL